MTNIKSSPKVFFIAIGIESAILGLNVFVCGSGKFCPGFQAGVGKDYDKRASALNRSIWLRAEALYKIHISNPGINAGAKQQPLNLTFSKPRVAAIAFKSG